MDVRKAKVERNTKETDIVIELNLDSRETPVVIPVCLFLIISSTQWLSMAASASKLMRQAILK